MANITTLNATLIDPGEVAYVPWEIWAVMFVVTLFFFVYALIGKNNQTLIALIATVCAGATAWLSGFISFHSVESFVFADGNATTVPVDVVYSPAWLSWLMMAFFMVGIVIAVKNMYVEYIASKPEWKQEKFYRQRRR